FFEGRLGGSLFCRFSCQCAVHLLACAAMSSDPSQFDEPIAAIRRQIDELTAAEGDAGLIEELQRKLTKVASEIYSKLTPWQKTLVARHPQPPYTLDFIAIVFEE